MYFVTVTMVDNQETMFMAGNAPIAEEFWDAQICFSFNTTLSPLQTNKFCFKSVCFMSDLLVSPTKLA